MTDPLRWWHPTIRARLALLYAAAFFLAGGVLVALMYIYLGDVVNHQLTVSSDVSGETLRHTSPDAHAALGLELQRAADETLRAMLIASLMLLGGFGVVAAGLGWLLAGRALSPLHRITATARRVADSSLHERIALDGPTDEIKDLADTFDAMLERLDRSFDNQRRFVANASHELRTPLTINRTLIEVALDDPDASEPLRRLGAKLLAVNQGNERLIDGLLTLAGSEQGVTRRIPVDLADIVRQVRAESHSAGQAAGVDIRAALQPAGIVGDPVLMERLVQNLVDNAMRYNLPADGWITVTTGPADDDHVHLTVENSGPRVEVSDCADLFQPFRRLPGTERLAESGDAAAGRGAGLGLSIVRAVTHAHGGDVQATPRDGGGLMVRVRLSAASRGL